MTFPCLRCGLRAGSVVPFKYLLVEGGREQARGVWATSIASDHHNNRTI